MSAIGVDAGLDAASASGGADEISRRLESLPASAFLWRLVILLSLGGCFEIYDLFLTGYIAPGLNKSGLLTTTTQAFFGFSGIGAFVAATFAGLFVGTFFLGFLADRFGRRAIFTWALLGYSAASVAMACQTTSGGVLSWRFLAGVGLGVEIITIDAYITELVPSRMRGRAFRGQSGRDVHRGSGRGRARLVAGAAVALRHRRLALGGADRRRRQHDHLGPAAVCAGKPALAGAARPNHGSGQYFADAGGESRRRRCTRRRARGLARGRNDKGWLRGPVQAALPFAGRVVHGVQFLPGFRLLRLCQLGADAPGREGHRG